MKTKKDEKKPTAKEKRLAEKIILRNRPNDTIVKLEDGSRAIISKAKLREIVGEKRKITRKDAEKIALGLAGVPKEQIILMGKFSPIPYATKILESNRFLLDNFKRFWRYDNQAGVWKEDAEIFIKNKLRTILLAEEQQKKTYIEEVVSYIKDISWKQKDLEEPLNKICLKNGILDLDTLEIEKHSPKYFFVNQVPVDFIPEADCPQIKKFLSEIVDEENVLLLQELIGYCLYKEYFIHKAFMLVGGGMNGKSTFLNLLKKFIGSANISSVPLQSLEYNRFSLSSLYGKLANIFADLSDKQLRGTSLFKMLVGQDYVPAERKFKDQFFFTNYAKLIFSANKIPKSPEDTNAFFRRWVIILFPNEFYDNPDKQLIKKLTTPKELSGLLNFAIEGLKRILKNGDFSLTKSVRDVREQYIRMSDSVGAFQMDMVLSAPNEFVEKKELYTFYCDYCREKGYPAEAENVFHRELQKKVRVEDYRPLLEEDGKKIRIHCWKGIKISNIKYTNNVDNMDNMDTTQENNENMPKNVQVVQAVHAFGDKINFTKTGIKEALEHKKKDE